MKKVMKDIFLKLMFNILKNYMNFMIYHFYLKIEYVEMLVANLNDKTQSVIHIKKLKQALNLGLVLEKVDQNAWLKPYIDMNTDLRKKVMFGKMMKKNEFGKDFF